MATVDETNAAQGQDTRGAEGQATEEKSIDRDEAGRRLDLLDELKPLPIEEGHKQAIAHSLASHGIASLSQLASHDHNPGGTVNMANASFLPPAIQKTSLDLSAYLERSFNGHQIPQHTLYLVAINAHVLSYQLCTLMDEFWGQGEAGGSREV